METFNYSTGFSIIIRLVATPGEKPGMELVLSSG